MSLPLTGLIGDDLYPGIQYYGKSGHLLWIIDVDGTILYDPVNEFIGRDLSDLSLKKLTALHAASPLTLSQPEGLATYLTLSKLAVGISVSSSSSLPAAIRSTSFP